MAKLTPDQVRSILRRRHNDKTPYSRLAREFGVSELTISRICLRCTWQSISVPDIGLEAISVKVRED